MTLALAFGLAMLRHPRHARVDDEDDVGLREMRAGLEAEMHRMIGRQIEIGRERLHDRNGEILREIAERRNGFRASGRARR